ncbi:MAG: DUF3551 domain-containing protein [Xanthobacteraceae bacterium]
MRFVLMLSTIAATTVLITPSKAQNYPWCAYYSSGDDGGGTNCGFITFEQCMETARGLTLCTKNSNNNNGGFSGFLKVGVGVIS